MKYAFAHSSATPEHGTPPEIVAAAHLMLGYIDLDPASSEQFNKVVQARWYYTRESDGLKHDWTGRVFLNPPSGENGRLVKAFWEKLMAHYRGHCDLPMIHSAIYIGFSIDQLQTLQNTRFGGPLKHPFPICIPRKRLQFSGAIEAPAQQGLFGQVEETKPVRGDSPTKPNFICYLPPEEVTFLQARARFFQAFSKFGEVR